MTNQTQDTVRAEFELFMKQYLDNTPIHGAVEIEGTVYYPGPSVALMAQSAFKAAYQATMSKILDAVIVLGDGAEPIDGDGILSEKGYLGVYVEICDGYYIANSIDDGANPFVKGDKIIYRDNRPVIYRSTLQSAAECKVGGGEV